MEPIRNIEELIRNKLHVTAGLALHDRVLARIRHAQEQYDKTTPALTEPGIRRMIMRSSIAKLAVAAVIIAVVAVGLFELIGTGSKSGVVWAEVAKKVEASRGVIYRNRATRSGRPDTSDYSVVYLSATHSRADSYKGDQITRTSYCDFDTKTVVWLAHDAKKYIQEPMSEQTLREQHGAWASPKRWVQEFLSKDYKKLGQKMIDGVLCEGLETTDPTFGVANFQVDSLVARVWVSVETGYPVLAEAEVVGDNGQVRMTGILDQFQWDVEVDPSIFEPKIPPGYTQI